MIFRTYTELSKLKTFEERFEYVKLTGRVGEDTFGFDRYLNQVLYNSAKWKSIRNEVIVRDFGCDLGIEDYAIPGKIIVHHMNPITIDEIMERDEKIFNPEYLITVSHDTHNAIHYSDDSIVRRRQPITRKPGDTCPWK